jgi:Inner membrane component of T3SS, cytoplasmic domain
MHTACTMDTTKVDPGAIGWAINDPVIRFRVVGSERVFDLTTADRWVLGSSPECSLHLDDPSGRVSRQHAAAVREGERWMLQDLDSTNGIRVNGEGRLSFQLVPGDEIAVGGITLLAESHRSIELHALLQRWLGWSMCCLGNVDRALCAVREMANLRAALFLNGAGPLVGVARRLHRVTLGDRPFVSLGWSECGEQELDRARNGTLCLDARELPRDMHAVLANLGAPDLRVRLVACADSAEPVVELAVISRIATISIPPLTERADELERLLEAYGWDAVEELGATCPGFQPGDLEWLRDSEIMTLDEIEDAARRLVALRNCGVTKGAKRLGITHGALSRWAHRRKIST